MGNNSWKKYVYIHLFFIWYNKKCESLNEDVTLNKWVLILLIIDVEKLATFHL